MTYSVKEVFYSLQGEGAQMGRPAIFCRFSGCNLWTGKEKSRQAAICDFCDTDFIGTDGQNGGKFKRAIDLVEHVLNFWPTAEQPAYIIFTGGEPALQLDDELIACFKLHQVELAIETNGTLPLPEGLDWICVSPKGNSTVVITDCNELKLVYPQAEAPPERFDFIKAQHYFLSCKNNPDSDLILNSHPHLKSCIDYCLNHPKWKLCLQTHKLLNID